MRLQIGEITHKVLFRNKATFFDHWRCLSSCCDCWDCPTWSSKLRINTVWNTRLDTFLFPCFWQFSIVFGFKSSNFSELGKLIQNKCWFLLTWVEENRDLNPKSSSSFGIVRYEVKSGSGAPSFENLCRNPLEVRL